MSKIKTFWDIAITWPIFFFSWLFPRSKQIWVFIGWHRGGPEGEIFADNTKYLFLYSANLNSNIRPIWLAKSAKLAQTLRSRGYEAYFEASWRGRWYALRSSYTIIDAFLQRQNFRYTGRSKIVQLLHGKGMKKKGYSEPQYRSQDYIFTPSDFVEKLLPTSFKRNSLIRCTGYPRNDVIFGPVPGSDICINQDLADRLKFISSQSSQNKILWYAPTFRRGRPTFDLEKILSPRHLNEWLESKNLHLIVSLHPKYRSQLRSENFSNIFFAEEGDYYPLMNYFSLLITDYSSVFTDFLLLDRPIIFYAYDRSEYESQEGLSIDYDKDTPGLKAQDLCSLMLAIETSLSLDSYRAERLRIRSQYHRHLDGKSSERAYRFLAVGQNPID